MTALMLASRNGHKEVIELLLKHGADLSIQANVSITAMIWLMLWDDWMALCAYARLCVYTSKCMWLRVCIRVCMYTLMRVSIQAFAWMRVCVIDVVYDDLEYLKACMFVYLWMREWRNEWICISVCTSVCMHVQLHSHVNDYLWLLPSSSLQL